MKYRQAGSEARNNPRMLLLHAPHLHRTHSPPLPRCLPSTRCPIYAHATAQTACPTRTTATPFHACAAGARTYLRYTCLTTAPFTHAPRAPSTAHARTCAAARTPAHLSKHVRAVDISGRKQTASGRLCLTSWWTVVATTHHLPTAVLALPSQAVHLIRVPHELSYQDVPGAWKKEEAGRRQSSRWLRLRSRQNILHLPLLTP